MRFSAQRSRISIIFDIRGLGFGGSNTALVVLTGVGKVSWSNDELRQYPWRARRGDWEPVTSSWTKPQEWWSKGADLWAMDAGSASAKTAAGTTTTPEITNNTVPEYILNFEWLAVSALGAEMYFGYVEGMDGPPPDMGEESDADLIAGFPQWSSAMTVQEHYSYPER
jgi:hypothetical protein